MIVDSSVLVAIVLRQPEYREPRERLVDEGVAYAGAPTLVETAIVLRSRIGPGARSMLEMFLNDLEVQTLPFGDRHWRVALEAFGRFGRGNHPAALDFGDCLTYATARVARQPLLCLGDDFRRTDIELA